MLERDSSRLEIESASVSVIRERVGIRLEETYPSSTHLGITLGQVFFTEPHYPTNEGTDGSGYFIRLDANQRLIGGPEWRATARGAYLFEQIYDSDEKEDDTKLHSVSAGIQLSGNITPWITLSGAADVGTLTGIQRISASTPTRRDAKWDETVGGQLTVEFNVEQGGYVGLSAGTGISRSVILYFERRV